MKNVKLTKKEMAINVINNALDNTDLAEYGWKLVDCGDAVIYKDGKKYTTLKANEWTVLKGRAFLEETLEKLELLTGVSRINLFL